MPKHEIVLDWPDNITLPEFYCPKCNSKILSNSADAELCGHVDYMYVTAVGQNLSNSEIRLIEEAELEDMEPEPISDYTSFLTNSRLKILINASKNTTDQVRPPHMVALHIGLDLESDAGS